MRYLFFDFITAFLLFVDGQRGQGYTIGSMRSNEAYIGWPNAFLSNIYVHVNNVFTFSIKQYCVRIYIYSTCVVLLCT